MAIQYLDREIFGLQEYIYNSAKRGLSGVASEPIYAHPVDGWIIRSLNSTPVKSVMNKAMDALVSMQFGQDLVKNVVIDQQSFPDLFSILAHCAKTLFILEPQAFARNDTQLFNAYTAGTDEYAFICISSGLCQFYSQSEACFVIGHECGHIAAGHATYHTLVRLLTGAIIPYFGFIGNLLRVTAGVPLMAWSRRAEVTADRAGLLCCGDITVAERALLRLVTGFADVERVDIEDYLRNSRNVEDFHKFSTQFHEIFASHPLIPKRIQALRLFANSELYYSLTGKSRPTNQVLLNQAELNRQVNQIIQP